MSTVSGQAAPAWSLVRPAFRRVSALFPDLTAAERRVCEAFPLGAWVDLPGAGEEREVRAGVLAALLLGAGEAEPGLSPAIRLRGARVTGRLDLTGATVRWPLACEGCDFSEAAGFAQSEAKTIRLAGCRLPGFDGTGMRLAGGLGLPGCTVGGPGVPGTVSLRGARIGGTVDLTAARITCPGEQALAAEGTAIGGCLECRELAVTGEVSLCRAHVGGDVDLTGAVLGNPGEVALRLSGATVGGELTLRPAGPVHGGADLSHARVGLLRDGPGAWPAGLKLGGLVYQGLEPALPARQRLRWLDSDPRGYQPQPYRQLAGHYSAAGQPAQARVVLLAGLRRGRRRMTVLPRVWGILQDVTLGYGYQPWRALAWLATLTGIGTAVYTLRPPPAVVAGAPHVHALAYTLALLLPVAGPGFVHAYRPAGAGLWLSYLLVAAGWTLAATAVAAVVRAMRTPW